MVSSAYLPFHLRAMWEFQYRLTGVTYPIYAIFTLLLLLSLRQKLLKGSFFTLLASLCVGDMISMAILHELYVEQICSNPYAEQNLDMNELEIRQALRRVHRNTSYLTTNLSRHELVLGNDIISKYQYHPVDAAVHPVSWQDYLFRCTIFLAVGSFCASCVHVVAIAINRNEAMLKPAQYEAVSIIRYPLCAFLKR